MPTTEPSLKDQIVLEIGEKPEAELRELLPIVRNFRDREIPVSARESLRRGLHQALTRLTRPVEVLSDRIDVEQGEAP